MADNQDDQTPMQMPKFMQEDWQPDFTPEQLNKYITPYHQVWAVKDRRGFIVWRMASGLNVELLHLKVETPGHGDGYSLLFDMVKSLGDGEPFIEPYETVFGFTRSCNKTAQDFYTRAGFVLSPVEGVYRDGSAVLFSQRYTRLRELCGLDPLPPITSSPPS